MTKIDSGGPAFPSHSNDDGVIEDGMTLREWFAGQVLAGMLANTTIVEVTALQRVGRPIQAAAEDFAHTAYALADAMLAERAKSR